MRKESKAERAAWSKHFGDAVAGPSKYGNEKAGKYDSGHEAEVAGKLAALERCGQIKALKEQVSFTLVEGVGRIRPIRYIADFTWIGMDGKLNIGDAKGWNKDKVYRLKKKLMKLMLGLDIQEL